VPALSLLHANIQERTESLSRDFQSAQPFRHLVIDDFVAAEFCRQLTAEFPAFDPKHAMNELGQVGGKAVFQNLPDLGQSYARLDRMLRDREFLDWVGTITGIPGLLYDSEYIGGGTHENLEGQDLDAHVDFNYHPKTHLHRRLNLILFLNPEWREEWGGALELHVNPWLPPEQNLVKTIVPLMNRCVIFETTESSWHGFKRIGLPPEKKNVSRRSIAVYFYTRTRPEEETAPDHSTVYVPRPMPEHIRAGRTLTEEDVQALRILMIRRDMQIQFLYEREKEFSRQMGFFNQAAPVLHSKSFHAYMALTGPARKCWSWYKNRPIRKQFEAKASQG
jgi:Rps23 Pro-64 3,4-dihydroxylase Tpa1-like proline 4-hydroxylase